MDLIIIVIHLLIAFFITSLPIIPSLLVVGYTVLWYILIDRMVINFLLVIPIRFVFTKILGQGDGTVDIASANFINEIVKAPISIYLGGYFLRYINSDPKTIYAFVTGYLLWTINIYFIGGILRRHPYRTIMFIGNILGVILGLFLLGEIRI